MSIIFSRHAKRRMKLYQIPEKVIIDIVSNLTKQGKHELVTQIPEFDYPIKIICKVEGKEIIIITVYPLKRGLK